MKNSAMMVLVGALFVASAALESAAAVPGSITGHVPGTMNYQGRLVAPSGAPYVDGTYTFDIRLFKEANAGTPLWGGTYSSYVKDGFFNIMLGAPGGAPLAGTTYTHTDLWKALWPDSANGATTDSLYLGVTPWNDANGNPIDPASRAELSPRQTLMTAPYAFRAQTAEYANEAAGDFAAGGRITTEHITTTGDLLNTVGSTVNVGGPDGNITANAVNINAKDIDINAGTYDIYMSSADRIDMDATGTIDIDGQGSMTVDTQSSLDLESLNSYTYVRGKSGVAISSSTGSIDLNPGIAVIGHDHLLWSTPGSSSLVSPIQFKSISLNLAAGSFFATASTGMDLDHYSCAIVGIKNLYGGNSPRNFYVSKSGGYWHVVVYFDRASTTSADSFTVDVMVVNRNFVTEQR